MSSYSMPRAVDSEIAGPSSELVGKLVFLRSEGVVTVGTSFGPAPTTRVTAYEATKKGAVSMGLRLIFWTGVQEALAKSEEPWLAGRIQVIPQANDPERTIYVLTRPDASEIPLLDAAYAQIVS